MNVDQPSDKAMPASLSPPQPVEPILIPQQADPVRRALLEIHAKLTAEFLGPFPTPETLARFEQIVPGSAAKIIAMAERQTNHRISLEKAVILSDIKKSWWGLAAGFTIGVLGLIGTVVLGLFDHGVVGGVLGGATLVSLVTVFVLGTSRRAVERIDKAKVASANEAQPPGSSAMSNSEPAA